LTCVLATATSPEPMTTWRRAPLTDNLDQSAYPGQPGAHPAARRWRAAALWVGTGLALYAFLLRISFSERINSDGANNALQAWDLVHGHLLLHGWHIGDATFYAFELPLNGIMQLIFGLGDDATHIASALTYLIVAACAAALAVADSRGAARAARCAVVVAVLAMPLLYVPDVWLLLEEPDHYGTAMFILVSFLLADRVPGRRFTAPLLCAILCAGQISDLTVRYVAVPAIVAVCAYRMLAARKLQAREVALATAAAASVPLEAMIRAVMVHLGGFVMVAPLARLSSPRLWPQHASVTWSNLRQLFGAIPGPDAKLGSLGAALGLACLLAAVAGLARVAWNWRRASRAEQLLAVAIVCNAGVYLISVMPLPSAGTHEIVAVLPCGAVLAARALVPARITGTLRAVPAAAATALVALVPLVTAATRPPMPPVTAPLTSWLAAHRLTYGVARYWDASAATLQSGDRVRIRAVDVHKNVNKPGFNIHVPGWETNALWYDASAYQATFALADVQGRYRVAWFEDFFGKPAATHRVGDWLVLVYRRNLLRQVLSMLP
jgi:hypothetical protein